LINSALNNKEKMVKTTTDLQTLVFSNQSNNVLKINNFKLTDEEIRRVYLNINDEEIDALRNVLVEFAKIAYNNNNNN
jgi:hypothetical protein